MDIVDKINLFLLKEEKQIGKLYHFTDIKNLISIIKKRKMNVGYNKKYGSAISFTRNYKLAREGFSVDRIARLTVDGTKLSNKYKIVPYSDPNFKNEEEEILITDKPIDIIPYITGIQILVNDRTKNDEYFQKDYDYLSKLLYHISIDKLKINIVDKWSSDV